MEKAEEIKTSQQFKDIPIGRLIVMKERKKGWLLIGMKTEECNKEGGYIACKVKNGFTSSECGIRFHRIAKMYFYPSPDFVYYKENNEYKHMYRVFKRKLYQAFKKAKNEQIIAILRGLLKI